MRTILEDHMYILDVFFVLLSVDATKESGRLGRLLNHSKSAANCATRLVNVKDHTRRASWRRTAL